MYDHLERKLQSGDLIILDGGTGTDIERRGVAMDDEFWCAMANLSHGDTVRAVHEDYIRAGAEVITANTYASSPLSFAARDREDEIEAIDREAVRLAREALDRVADAPVALAGSVSTMSAIVKGTDDGATTRLEPDRIRALYRRKTEVLADAGCDLLIMEMMTDLHAARLATEAAVATGLPVWVGMSFERVDGALVSEGNHQHTPAELTRGLMIDGARVALIMHSEISVTDEALEGLRADWDGPFGAYPESGYFEMPHWVFQQLSPEDFVNACRRWREAGASVLGGCCGITPAHIEALAAALGPTVAQA
ncbi:MAG: homocysteine S-methyltransferase family protein [Halofilum sp. (in: g-proteobacteria)]|nr:homocysteine S-methyltransferase family protein [Halofilum sp. (in: g-proteobacteria)]